MTTRALVVGATGNLGGKIALELVKLGANVRATYRPSSKPERLDVLRDAGVELALGDLEDAASLASACRDVGVVVSAAQGLRATIVDGQARLLDAAAAAGVPRMIPSDYSLDFFETEPGRNRNLDLRREFDGLLDRSPVRGSSVLCGAFMDLIAFGALGPDPDSGIYRVFGSPDQPYDFTHTDDVAKYTAEVALDGSAPRVVRVAGDTISPRELGEIVAEVRGISVTIENAGSLEDLDRMIDGMRARDPAPDDPFPVWQRLQYARDLASGRGKLEPLDNARYPSVRPRRVRELLAGR